MGSAAFSLPVSRWIWRTGRVRVLHIVAVHDCGIVMNRLAVESQINGGVIQGLGFALTEDRVVDRQTGRILNPNLEEYKLPGPWEMPVIEPIVYEAPDATGVSGIAEGCVIPTAGQRLPMRSTTHRGRGCGICRLCHRGCLPPSAKLGQ